MPGTGRLYAPRILHHVMIRGIEGKKIFRNNKDRDNFIERLEILCPEMHLSCPPYSAGKKLELSKGNISVFVERGEMIAKAGDYSLEE